MNHELFTKTRRQAVIFFAMGIFILLPPRLFAAAPTLPTIGTNNIVVTNSTYGASTSSANNATAINNAITAVSKLSGGGTVEIPGPGTYLAGPITFKSKVNLQIDSGATLQMLPYGTWSGTTTFINGSSLSDVEISGLGTIDGQGAAWWAAYNADNSVSRPDFINFSGTARILIQDVTLQNPPTFTLMLKGKNSNITIQRININTPYPSPNTDGMDLASTNILIQNSHISDGDDNIEIGGSSAVSAWITVTNCMFGHGHGVSIGSDLQDGVHDLTVINCVFTNTDNGIRAKSDYDKGGVVQNLNYYNIGMTNIKYAPILIYSYYEEYGDPTTVPITPAVAAGSGKETVSSTMPTWRNIVISNLTATAGEAGLIWARTEFPATNITLSKISITASGPFDAYNVKGLRLVDFTNSAHAVALFNAQATFTNSATGATSISLTGLASTNTLAFYNQSASFSDGTFFDADPITLSGSTLADGTGLTLASSTPVNFGEGSSAATMTVSGDLTVNNTLNISDSGGFGAGTYTLFSYTGNLSGTPALGSKPAGYNYSLDTSTAGQINLLVTSTNTSGVKPSISTEPTNQLVAVGGTATFTVAAGGTSPLHFQWYFNTNNILANATNTSFVIPTVQTTNAGTYSVIVTNSYGMATSSVPLLTIKTPPIFNTVQAAADGSGDLVFTGGNGVPFQTYYLLTSTNMVLPLDQWTILMTNEFDSNGNFNFTNTPGTSAPGNGFFRLEFP